MSNNPYIHKGKKPTHLESVFAFIDILGYTELTLEAASSGKLQQFLESVHGALSDGRKWLEYDSSESVDQVEELISQRKRCELKAFTDSIVIGWPILDDAEMEFGSAFMRLAYFQFQMIISGFFIRGAISIGNAYIDDIVVSGDALIEAYQAEVELARDPRIVLSGSATKVIRSHLEYYFPQIDAPQNSALLEDPDGQWFLNYLDQVVYPGDGNVPEYARLSQHKTSIESCLSKYKNEPRKFSKYEWAAGYHNHFCNIHKVHFDKNFKIETDTFRANPKSIVKPD